MALLIGFEKNHAALWQIFSYVAKLLQKIKIEGKRTEEKILYNFHESVINVTKPIIKKGIKSVVLVSPQRTTYSKDFLEHIQNHHSYLLQARNSNRVIFSELVGSIEDQSEVAELVKTEKFKKIIEKTTSEEADQLINNLEKRLHETFSNSFILYSLEEIEDVIYSRKKNAIKAEYLLLTDKYLVKKQKKRIYRLLQIAENKKVKTRVIESDTPAGNRINQFGGIVFFTY